MDIHMVTQVDSWDRMQWPDKTEQKDWLKGGYRKITKMKCEIKICKDLKASINTGIIKIEGKKEVCKKQPCKKNG